MVFEEITGFVVKTVSEPVSLTNVIFVILILMVLVFIAHHFMSIAFDIWKLPFAIIIDAADLLAYNNGYFDIAAAVAGFVLFWAFSEKENYSAKIFAVLVAAEALIGVWIFPQFAFITNVIPLCTLFTLFLIRRR